MGYRQALRAHRIRFYKQLVAEGGRQEGFEQIAMSKLLKNRPLPTAIFCANDHMAIAAIAILKSVGLRVPEDVAIVGFDNSDKAPIVEPPLTSVHVPRADLGKVAAERLLLLIERPDSSPIQTLLPTKLVIRASCGCRA